MKKDLTDIAYEFVKNHLKNKKPSTTMTFEQIAKGVQKAADMTDAQFDEVIGDFYVDLLQDRRIIFLGDNKWQIKDHMTKDDYNANLNKLYDYDPNNRPEEMLEHDEEYLESSTVMEDFDDLENEYEDDDVDYDSDDEDDVLNDDDM